MNASTSPAKVTIKFLADCLPDLPASGFFFPNLNKASSLRRVTKCASQSHLTHPVAPHGLVSIGSTSRCSGPTHCQPHTGYSPPCLSLHSSHPLNYLQAPEFPSKSSLQTILCRLLSTPMLSRMNSRLNSLLCALLASVCPPHTVVF